MLDRIPVDTKAFVGVMQRDSAQKTQRKDKDNPDSEQVPVLDKNGVPKWSVYLSVETRSSFGKKQYDDIEVTVTKPKNPGEGLNGKYVTPVGLTLGMMPIGKGKAVTIFYTADDIIPLKDEQPAQPGQATRITPAQPLQPARVSSGQ
jgi:hypothetical protein